MEDVQSSPAGVALPIDRVGVRGLVLPLQVRERTTSGLQRTVARVDASVDLPATFKGTHMSRFVVALNTWASESDGVDYQTVRELLQDIRTRLEARRAHVVFHFPYFVSKKAPASGIASLMHYECTLTGLVDETTGPNMEFQLDVTVPVMTVCPCSKAISDEGAHSQRAEVRMSVRMRGFCWIEDLIEAAEASASSSLYGVLKREDEKYVTEHAFAAPTFVEDVVRNVAQRLAAHPHITTFSVEVESFESIHAHNAFARIGGGGGGF